MTDAGLSNISPYLPGALSEWSSCAEAARPLPSIEHFEGVFLVVDISGFTKLSERLARHGKEGAEPPRWRRCPNLAGWIIGKEMFLFAAANSRSIS